MAKENTVFFHTSEGDQIINVDEQRKIEKSIKDVQSIKRQINLNGEEHMEEEFSEEELNADILEILNDRMNEEHDFDPDGEMSDLEGIDGYDENSEDNKIEDDRIFTLIKSLYTKYQSEDLNKDLIDVSIKLALLSAYVKYRKYINLSDDVEIKERIVEQFKDVNLLRRLIVNYSRFYERFDATLRDSFESQESSFWKGLEDVIKFKFKEETPDFDEDEMKRYIKNARSAAIRTNKQTQKYLHNFVVRFMQMLELAFIYGVYLINIDKLYRLDIDAEHLTFIGINCSYLFPEFKETKIVIRDPTTIREDRIGLVGLNNILEYFLSEQRLTDGENMSIMENLSDAVVYKFGAMRGLTKYSELSAKYDLLNARYNKLRMNDEILLRGYYDIINEISERIKPGSELSKYLKQTSLSTVKLKDEEIQVQFFRDKSEMHDGISYSERLPAIVMDFLARDKLIHEK